MVVLAQFPATPGQFVKDNMTDVVNLFLGWAVFWCYGFRLIYWCGYTSTQTVSRFFCGQFYNDISQLSACEGVGFGEPWLPSCDSAWREVPAYALRYRVVRACVCVCGRCDVCCLFAAVLLRIYDFMNLRCDVRDVCPTAVRT